MLYDFKRKKDIIDLIGILILLIIPALIGYNSKTELQAIRESGSLKLVTLNTPSTYFLEKGQPAGFEYELAKAFADHIGVSLEIIVAPSFSDLFTLVKNRDADIAGANLTITPQRQESFAFSPSYLHTSSALIYRIKQGSPAPKKLESVIGQTIVVPTNSSHIDVLKKLKAENPELTWQESDEPAIDLLEQVHERKVDFTVMDEVTYNSQSSYFPGVNKSMLLNKPQPLAWMYSPHPDDSLKHALERFFAKESTLALIEQLKTKYFQRENRLNFFDTITFRNQMETRFPKLEAYFHDAEAETGINWQLLAAIAYQESHWNRKAVSPTGVRGIMMLTRATAKEMGIKNRTNAEQSIRGGARYLKKVIAKIPERIQGEDRIWFGLASYNVGYGHLEDARILTQRAGKNPDKWKDVREFLPLLTKPRYYKTVKRGYARGYEPVIYVKNIQRYLDLIRWEFQLRQMREASKQGPLPDSSQSASSIKEAPLTL
ncbi:membrane-bound lytic murein transglycosylase MltF [Pontibacterium granulatum]|uniref:membrane-bound lytic murein transglycosylase MltF n=1 Tax=Pontibacterium granulatum TaxID=2036029 RepID=UPI002499C154|nr:membrane-bound lytic murein transglycosylase MltF [Pontibacterium granulatum]MDI3322774.1 membrane-bound lytic murein transglycosylase MltF [Pontibacterium granulatum]